MSERSSQDEGGGNQCLSHAHGSRATGGRTSKMTHLFASIPHNPMCSCLCNSLFYWGGGGGSEL